MQKRKEDAIKKHENVMNTFKLNEECEDKLKIVSNYVSFNEMTIEHLNKATLPFLKAFVQVRTAKDLTSIKDKDVPSKKEN